MHFRAGMGEFGVFCLWRKTAYTSLISLSLICRGFFLQEDYIYKLPPSALRSIKEQFLKILVDPPDAAATPGEGQPKIRDNQSLRPNQTSNQTKAPFYWCDGSMQKSRSSGYRPITIYYSSHSHSTTTNKVCRTYSPKPN